MPIPCSEDSSPGSKIQAQTLFLGATVLSFNVNMGWDGQASSLTVELIEDKQPVQCYIPQPYSPSSVPLPQYKENSYPDNHYYTCTGNSCYVDENGNAYNPPISLEKKVPGKIYHVFTDQGVVSRYWYKEDPGFFGTNTSIHRDGTYDPTIPNSSYDIIGVPVCFIMDKFIFLGVVQGWEKRTNAGQSITYSVTIESFDKVLQNSYAIIDQYAGSIFSKLRNNTTGFGAPRNYVQSGPDIKYFGKISEGNIPNVFNVYGFLESLGMDYFGGSKKNENGLPAVSIIDALSVLTSYQSIASQAADEESTESATRTPRSSITAFSPFGRILTKTAQTTNTYLRVTPNFKNYSFGVIPPSLDGERIERTSFILDLSELPRPPVDYRISGNNGVISITDLIKEICEASGRDFYTTAIPVKHNEQSHIVIKIRTVDRTIQPSENQIQNTIKQLELNGYGFNTPGGETKIISANNGKEANQSTSKILYIGGKQERLYQAKSYRLAYSQNNYIYHPTINKFIDYTRYKSGKIRMPSGYSTRNKDISVAVNGSLLTNLWSSDELIKKRITGLDFNTEDDLWRDSEVSSSALEFINSGNYTETIKEDSGISTTTRYIPLYKDIICPFFGYNLEDQISIDSYDQSNNFRSIRPVWFDTWTGQIVVVFDLKELPILSFGEPIDLYKKTTPTPTTTGTVTPTPFVESDTSPTPTATPEINPTVGEKQNTFPGFVITESEFRAAIASFDSYLTYCLAKATSCKPDLFVILVEEYKKRGILLSSEPTGGDPTANIVPAEGLGETNNMPQSNSAGEANQPSTAVVAQANSLGVNWNAMLDSNFLKDLKRIVSFIASIGSKYYGQEFMVKIPEISSYKDSQYSDIKLPARVNPNGESTSVVSVFSGSGKIFYNYEPCEYAWEEPGNIIDDSIVVGTPNWYVLSNDKGQIPPILGFNESDNFDYVIKNFCSKSLKDLIYGFFDDPDMNLEKAVEALMSFGIPITRRIREYIKTIVGNDNKAASSAADTLLNELDDEKCDPLRTMVPSLDTSDLDPSSYIIVQTSGARKDAFDETLTEKSSRKLYTIGSLATNELAFFDPINLREPRVIIKCDRIPMNTASYSYQTDPSYSVIANVSIEDLIIFLKTRGTKLTKEEEEYKKYLMRFIVPLYDEDRMIKPGPSSNKHTQQVTLSPKYATPFFAGIPVRSNQYCYGPWTNYPVLSKDTIFPDLSDEITKISAVENLIGGLKIESRSDFVPWEYGGMSFLDRAVFYEIQNNASYQTILESAQITIPGLPIFGIGGQFVFRQFPSTIPPNQYKFNNDLYELSVDTKVYSDIKKPLVPPLGSLNQLLVASFGGASTLGTLADATNRTVTQFAYQVLKLTPLNNNPSYPTVSNMNISVDSNGARTSYQLRTYSKKLGSFNKENLDRLKQFSLNNLALNKQIAKNRNRALTSANQQRLGILEEVKTGRESINASKWQTNLFGTSPTEILIGQASPYLENPSIKLQQKKLNHLLLRTTTDVNNIKEAASSGIVYYGKDPGDNQLTYDQYVNNPISGAMNNLRVNSWVGMFPGSEVLAELSPPQYNTKSVMSLDGLFSPISFYPTMNNSTYPLLSYHSYVNNSGSVCPRCQNKGKIKNNLYNFKDNTLTPNVEYACPLCSKGKIKLTSKSSKSSSTGSSSEILPPYIIASGSDISLLRNFLSESSSSSTDTTSSSSSNNSSSGSGISINLTSLQPIVVPYGEFKNPNVQATGERSRHSIQVVGRGDYPVKDSMALSISSNLDKYFDPDTGERVYTNGVGVNADFYEMDLLKKQMGGNSLLNHRFFGLRGPLMMHGWGYDTEGYPVPNAADEPQEIDAQGRPKRFILTPDGENDYTSDGAFVPTENQLLGDILGKGYKKEGGKWVKKKSKYFYLNWAERPDLWPVGPIDLRWDENRRVWVGGGSGGGSVYKMVYVTLEEDLVKEDGFDETYPARGFLDDVEYSSQALPNNARRLVYIKDRSGFTAPRGAKLLCRYDADTGFYEPVSKPSHIVFGKIGNGTTATLELAYVQGIKRGENTPTMLVTFDNSKFKFNIQSGKTGMFMFSNGKWLLLSVEP